MNYRRFLLLYYYLLSLLLLYYCSFVPPAAPRIHSVEYTRLVSNSAPNVVIQVSFYRLPFLIRQIVRKECS